MHAARWISFTFWILTSFILLAIAFKYEPVRLQPVHAVTAPQAPNFQADSISHLFHFDETPKIQLKKQSNEIKLLGVTYANKADLSNALIQVGKDVSTFSLHSKLPNGARLVYIDKHSVTYEQNGQRERLELEKTGN